MPATNLSFNARPDGKHAEWFWKREVAAGYQWLYAPGALLSGRKRPTPLAFSAYPTPTKDQLRVELPLDSGEARLELMDAAGRIGLDNTVHSGDSVNVRELARGSYLLRVSAGKRAGTQALIIKE